MSKAKLTKWKVTADHPTARRIDKFNMSKQEALSYAASIKPLEYENINVTIDGPKGDI